MRLAWLEAAEGALKGFDGLVSAKREGLKAGRPEGSEAAGPELKELSATEDLLNF